MNMWFLIIMLLSMALVVGPMMMMRPDPIQKNKERMRAIAYAKGIRFSIKKLPQQASELEPPAPIAVYFFAPAKTSGDTDWLLIRAAYEHEIHFLGHWAWQKQGRATPEEQLILTQHLPLLPDAVRAVSAGSQGVCVYWSEKGGDAVLERVIALLEALKREHDN
jgi:hypothetical protein